TLATGTLLASGPARMKTCVALLVACIPIIAHADPAAYVQAEGLVGGASPIGLDAMVGIEGGYRLAHGPFWVRGAVAYGPGGDDQGGGSVGQVRAGLEARWCGRERALCGVVALDLGGQYATWQHHQPDAGSETGKGLLMIPRIGLDTGGDHIRFRLA